MNMKVASAFLALCVLAAIAVVTADAGTGAGTAGGTLALTPSPGWNSWNTYGLDVNDARVRATAHAFLNTGLAAHGWSNGEFRTNVKFPEMLAPTSNYLHERGFHVGIHSSPGPLTCGRFLGSLDHEQGAASYARWGIDYLRYDLCNYAERRSREKALAQQQEPYRLMGEALRTQLGMVLGTG